jgi:hypothetical protein
MADGEDRTEDTPETDDAATEVEETEETAAEAAPEDGDDSADEGAAEDEVVAAEADDAEEADEDDSADDSDDDEPASASMALEPEGEPEMYIRMAPHSEGLFETNEVDVSKIDVEVFEGVYAGHRHRSKAAMGALIAASAFTLLGTAAIIGDDDMARDFECFVNGTVEECKTAEVEKTKKMWRNEDHKSRNMYGNVSLTFFPADSRVKITQTQKHTDGDSWRMSEGLAKCPATDATVGGAEAAKPKPKPKGAADAPAPQPVKGAIEAAKFQTGTHSREIPNQTTALAEGQTIQELPLENLPIFETRKNDFGCVGDVLNYEYLVEFTREGYYDQKRTWRRSDWKRIGPGNMIIEWPGLDLEPKPETIKANFSKVMHQEHCLRKTKKLTTLDDSMKDPNFEIMLLRSGFKTREDFIKVYDTLTKTAEHAEWWKGETEKIKVQKCEE